MSRGEGDAKSPCPRNSSKRILIIGPSNVGDAVLASDVIAATHQQFPDAHLTLVVGGRAEALFGGDPRVHNLMNMDLFDSPAGRVRLALELWRSRPHLVVDLRHTAYPLLLKPLSVWRYLRQPPKAITHMRDRQLWKFRAQVPQARRSERPTFRSAGDRRSQADRGGHRPAGAGVVAEAGRPPRPAFRPARFVSLREAKRNLWGFRSAGDRRSQAKMKDPVRDGRLLWRSEQDTAQVERLWRRWQLDGRSRVVVICPGARSHIKRWGSEGFAVLADRLITTDRVQVIFSGEPSEGPVIHEILTAMRHKAHNAVGLTTIRQLGVLMQRARLVITNDSAALHVASALQVPTVAIFGPTDERKYGPTAPQQRTIRRRLFCAPCEQSLCRFNHECMRFIPPEEVYEAARALLGGQKQKSRTSSRGARRG